MLVIYYFFKKHYIFQTLALVVIRAAQYDKNKSYLNCYTDIGIAISFTIHKFYFYWQNVLKIIMMGQLLGSLPS